MSAIRIDESCPPIVLTVFRGKQTDQDVEEYIAAMDAMYARGRRYAGVTFMLQYAPERRHLGRVAEWTRATKPRVKELCVGAAMVAPSPTFRFLLSSLLMIQPLPVPYRAVGEVDEAADWIAGQLTAARLEVPRNLREHLRCAAEPRAGLIKRIRTSRTPKSDIRARVLPVEPARGAVHTLGRPG